MDIATSRHRRLPQWARVLLWVAGALLLGAVAVVVWFVAMLSGGLDDLLGGPGPREDDARVVEAGEVARAKLAAEADDLLGLTGGGEPVATAEASRCQEGQHNWKIDDPYDLSCSRDHTAIVVGGPATTFREDMVDLDAALVRAGWVPASSSIPEVLEGYWDGRDSILEGNPGWTYPHRMPSAGYTRDDMGLSVDWLEAASLADDDSLDRSDLRWVTPAGDRVDSDDVAALLPTEGYGIRLRLSTGYFEE